jgi:hypothetical protein
MFSVYGLDGHIMAFTLRFAKTCNPRAGGRELFPVFDLEDLACADRKRIC